MPQKTEWVPNEVALTHNGVTIYRSYKDDDFDQPHEFWFHTSPHGSSNHGEDFDVRDIPGFGPEPQPGDREGMAALQGRIEAKLKEAIDRGWLTQNGLKLPKEC